MRRILMAAALAFTLAGCAGGDVQRVVQAVTTGIRNPVQSTDIYRAETVFAAGLRIVANYRRLCWSKPYRQLVADPLTRPVCENRRAIVRGAQVAAGKADAAIGVAKRIAASGDTLRLSDAIAAAWTAVNEFQARVPAVQ